MKKFLKNIGKIIAFFMIWAVLGGLIDIPSENPAIWRFGAELIPFALMALLSIVFWLLEKRRIPVFTIKHAGKNTATGLITGLLWIGIPVGILYLIHVIVFNTLCKNSPILYR